jgi:lysophospholipase L1-like esterase
MKRKYLYILPILAILGVACEPSIGDDKINSETYYAGKADFSTYVAVGNSLTAGYMDNTVYRSGQKNSFPNILAQQFKEVGGGEFTQPSYADDVNDVGGLLLNGQPLPGFGTKMIVNMSTGGPENIKGTPTIDISASTLQKKAYNNAGVPGAKVFHLLAPGYGSLAALAQGKANPYFVRTATSDETTVLGDAMSLKPTFFTNWIGANDVLGYATSGGEGVDQNEAGGIDPSLYGSNDITHAGVFKQAYETIVNTLTSQGANGVVATIPYVTTIPFFTTVPYNPLTPEAVGVENIDQLNQFIGLIKMSLSAVGQGDRIDLFSKTEANPVLIQDKTLEDMSGVIKMGLQQAAAILPLTAEQIELLSQQLGRARHATGKDLLLLTSRTQIGADLPISTGNPVIDNMLKIGITIPLSDAFVLNPIEQQKIKDATDQFNAIIRGSASEHNLAVADMNELLTKAVSGLRVEDGQIYTADYFQGLGNLNTVLFSLDGVHLNARGYAFIALEILKEINKHYEANIPLVNPAVYPGPTLLPKND